MITKKNNLWGCLLALTLSAFCLILSNGCRPPEPVDLTIVSGGDPESLDPAVVTGQPDIRAAAPLFAGLTAPNPETSRPEPCLAESWEISPDGKTYLFHIRPNLHWSTGEPLTAHDFVYSWRRVLAPQTAAPYAGLLYSIVNAKELNTGVITDPEQLGIKAVQDLLLEVKLMRPTAYFLDICAMTTLSAVPSFTIEKYQDQWIRQDPLPVCGPYQLKGWRLNDSISYIKNPYYWDAEHTQCERIKYLTMSSANTVLNLFLQGEVDIVWDQNLIPTDLREIMLEREDVHPYSYLGLFFIRINVTRPPLNNPLVRQALVLALDKEKLISRAMGKNDKPQASLVSERCGTYIPAEGLGYNPALARSLLAKAGYPNGRDFPPISYMFNAASGGAAKLQQKIAIELQQIWKENLNIQIDLRQMEWKTTLSMMSKLEYDICRSSWIADYNDPTSFLDIFRSGDGNNRTGWSNKDYDALLEQASNEVDSQKRNALLREAETILLQKGVPIIPLSCGAGMSCYDDKKLGGIYPNPLDFHPVAAIYRKDKQTKTRPVPTP